MGAFAYDHEPLIECLTSGVSNHYKTSSYYLRRFDPTRNTTESIIFLQTWSLLYSFVYFRSITARISHSHAAHVKMRPGEPPDTNSIYVLKCNHAPLLEYLPSLVHTGIFAVCVNLDPTRKDSNTPHIPSCHSMISISISTVDFDFILRT